MSDEQKPDPIESEAERITTEVAGHLGETYAREQRYRDLEISVQWRGRVVMLRAEMCTPEESQLISEAAEPFFARLRELE